MACGTDGLYKTTDGGDNWTQVTANVGAYSLLEATDVEFHSTNEGFVIADADQQMFFFTSNGGSTWSGQPVGTTETVQSLSVYNVELVFVSANSGTIVRLAR